MLSFATEPEPLPLELSHPLVLATQYVSQTDR
jgi:hypothetical protein